jgi:hypothetical protein
MKKYYIILSVFILLATYFTYGKVDYSETLKLTTTGNFYFIGGNN